MSTPGRAGSDGAPAAGSFARSLAQPCLVDEHAFTAAPACAGEGTALFAGFTRLLLVSGEAFSSPGGPAGAPRPPPSPG